MIKINKLSEKAVSPKLVNGTYELTCTDIATFVVKDGRMVLDYRTDLSIEIPEGYVGILTPLHSIAGRSIILTDSISVLMSDENPVEITAKFKINTDSVPVIYEPGEVFIRLIVVPILSELEISEYVVPIIGEELPVENIMSQSISDEVVELPLTESDIENA
jgi:dUTPase